MILLSPVQDVRLTQDVNAALIKQIFDRANLSNINVNINPMYFVLELY